MDNKESGANVVHTASTMPTEVKSTLDHDDEIEYIHGLRYWAIGLVFALNQIAAQRLIVYTDST
jgi:hypothetical protein